MEVEKHVAQGLEQGRQSPPDMYVLVGHWSKQVESYNSSPMTQLVHVVAVPTQLAHGEEHGWQVDPLTYVPSGQDGTHVLP